MKIRFIITTLLVLLFTVGMSSNASAYRGRYHRHHYREFHHHGWFLGRWIGYAREDVYRWHHEGYRHRYEHRRHRAHHYYRYYRD